MHTLENKHSRILMEYHFSKCEHVTHVLCGRKGQDVSYGVWWATEGTYKNFHMGIGACAKAWPAPKAIRV